MNVKVPTMPAYFAPECGTRGYCTECAEPVSPSLSGRWFITMGHAGFNSSANNRNGYANREAAVKAHKKYAGGTK